jgi:hypothetical protein
LATSGARCSARNAAAWQLDRSTGEGASSVEGPERLVVSRPVYSTNFVAVRSPSYSDEFVVPAGDTAIVTHMSFYNGVDQPENATGDALQVTLDDGGIYVWTIAKAGLAIAVYQWVGREVFTVDLSINATAVTYSFRASGYLLTPT